MRRIKCSLWDVIEWMIAGALFVLVALTVVLALGCCFFGLLGALISLYKCVAGAFQI